MSTRQDSGGRSRIFSVPIRDMARQMKQGEGWRVGWNPDASVFCGLIGGSDWALELTQAELDDVCRLSHQLAETMRAMALELMDEERICCELESDLVWLEAEGYATSFGLRVLLLTGRGAEGAWDAAVVPEVLYALQTLRVF
ncbi:DUF1818 family protein [Leptolyngbya sp. AN02str]|uniref:DUF1818 family protein n=1 Tax=Leptolyngbya sp. AN02str TaxID=3423363 RepID=UPI003D323737